MSTEIEQLFEYIQQALKEKTLERLTLSQCMTDYPVAQGLSPLQKISCRLIKLQHNIVLSAIFHHQQQDITQNYPLDEALQQISAWSVYFKQINLMTHQQEIQLKKAKNLSFYPSNHELMLQIRHRWYQHIIEKNNVISSRIVLFYSI